MKALLRPVVAGLVLLAAAASPALAQTQVTLTGTGSINHGGVRVGAYQARLGSDPTTPSVDVFCVDYAHTVSLGQTWTANMTNLMSGDLSATRGGDASLAKYQQMAWLTTKFDGASTADTRAIHTAIWNIMTPGTPAMFAGATNWYNQAMSNYLTSGLDYSTFAVVTDVNFRNGGRQEFLTRVPTTVTPEPGTYLLMASGLVGVAGIVRRRRRDQQG